MQTKPKPVRKGKGSLPHSETSDGIKVLQSQMLLDVSRTVAAFETLDEMLSALVDMTTEAVGADRGTIFLHDSRTGCHTQTR